MSKPQSINLKQITVTTTGRDDGKNEEVNALLAVCPDCAGENWIVFSTACPDKDSPAHLHLQCVGCDETYCIPPESNKN